MYPTHLVRQLRSRLFPVVVNPALRPNYPSFGRVEAAGKCRGNFNGRHLVRAAVVAVAILVAGEELAVAAPISPISETSGRVRVGTTYAATFAVTGPSRTVGSYVVNGLPPGLAVTGGNFSAGTNSYSLNGGYWRIAGTPTTVGTYAVTVTAWEFANQTGASRAYVYSLRVNSEADVVPVITTQPVSTSVTVGHAVSFSAGNTGGAIQWQSSTDGGSTWTNLTNTDPYSGTQTSTLVVTNATTALNGSRYRFVATDSGGSANSSSAILTVAAALFPYPTGIALDSAGNLYVGDVNSNTIKKVDAAGQVSLVAGAVGTAGSTDGSGANARFNLPGGIALAADGTLFVADAANATIRRISAAGVVTTVAGTATTRGSADGTTATFSQPQGLALDAAGNLFVADSMNNTIRKITPSGVVSTFAGAAGMMGTADGLGSAARFNLPTGLVIDRSGTLYVSDTTNNTVRKITVGGQVSTLAGLEGVSGSQNGSGGGALFNHPGGLAIDASGNLFLADTGNSVIRRITPAGVVTTVAGLAGIAGLMDGVGIDAYFNQPQALAVDAGGNILVADTGNATLRKIASDGTVTTLALTLAPSPVPPPAPTPTPVPTPTPTPASGGGGGGGSVAPWFLAALGSLAVMRRIRRRGCLATD